jgi:DNA-binding transcriptional LysR family regulator
MHVETLKTFCDLVESGSFNRAAALGFVSQSAVSQQLKALEIRFGRRLLERGSRRGIVLTDAGRQLYAECKELLGRWHALEERLKQPSAAIAGVVKLATVYSIGLHELPPYVTRFMKAHPQVKVHVEYGRTDKARHVRRHHRFRHRGVSAAPGQPPSFRGMREAGAGVPARHRPRAAVA